MNEDDTAEDDSTVPLLTETVDEHAAAALVNDAHQALMAELQTQLASTTMDFVEVLLHTAFREMEATLFEQVSNRLRQELPELIDRILRDHLEHSGTEGH